MTTSQLLQRQFVAGAADVALFLLSNFGVPCFVFAFELRRTHRSLNARHKMNDERRDDNEHLPLDSLIALGFLIILAILLPLLCTVRVIKTKLE